MQTRTYEALLSSPQHVAQARAAKSAIERAGGTLEFTPTAQRGMTLVVLTLPIAYWPDTFVPGLPFYPV